MKRIISALALLSFATTLGIAGCGGDDDDGGANTAGKSAGGEPSTSNPEGGAPSSGNVGCDPSEATTCQNETDCPFVADGTARTTAQKCGKTTECLSGQDENCARDCMLRELDMSEDCAGCYATFVNCTIKECLGECLTDPDSDGCHECQVTKGCRGAFNTCSGLPE